MSTEMIRCRTIQGPVENPGINQRALKHLFNEIEERKDMWTYTVNVSSVEIYNEVLRYHILSKNWKIETEANCSSPLASNVLTNQVGWKSYTWNIVFFLEISETCWVKMERSWTSKSIPMAQVSYMCLVSGSKKSKTFSISKKWVSQCTVVSINNLVSIKNIFLDDLVIY